MGAIDLGGLNAINYPPTDSTTGGSIAIGSGALVHESALASTAFQNTVVGYQSMSSTSMTAAATGNSALGYQALSSNTSGNSNTAIGQQALKSNTTGTGNVAVGAGSMESTSASTGSVAVGQGAMKNSGFYSVAVGYGALSFGGAWQDVAVGSSALSSSPYSGGQNTAVGNGAGVGVTSGTYNTLLGFQAGYDLSTGTNNTLIGQFTTTGVGVTTGSNNILVGKDVRPPSQTGSNQLNIGNLIYATGLGSGATQSTGNVGIGTTAPGAGLDVALAGAASTPGVQVDGAWYTSGTGSTNTPQLLVQPSGTSSSTWSTHGTGLGVNAVSGFNGNLLDLQVNGTSVFAVSSNGTITGTISNGSVDWAAPSAIGSTTPAAGSFTALAATGYTQSSGNFAMSGTGTLTTGTGNVSLNGATTVAANQNLTMASGTGQFSQTYTGTANAATITANSLGTGTAALTIGSSSTSGTVTGIKSSLTGAATTNIAGYFSATGATNNYGLLVPNGNVGIGTASPGYPLDINLGTNAGEFSVRSIGFNNAAIGNDSDGPLTFFTNNVASMSLSHAGGLSVGSTYYSTDPGSGNMIVQGNVGIGTSTPGSALTVANGGSATTPAITSTGAIVANQFTVSSGTTVNFAQGNVAVLTSAVAATTSWDLTNMVSGGAYTVIVNDTGGHTYSFNAAGSACASESFQPTNAATTAGSLGYSVYTILYFNNGGGNCLISWISGF